MPLAVGIVQFCPLSMNSNFSVILKNDITCESNSCRSLLYLRPFDCEYSPWNYSKSFLFGQNLLYFKILERFYIPLSFSPQNLVSVLVFSAVFCFKLLSLLYSFIIIFYDTTILILFTMDPQRCFKSHDTIVSLNALLF